MVVVRSLPSTLAATTLCAFGRMYHDRERPIGQDFHAVNGSILDIKDGFEYLFVEHTFPSLYVVFVAEKSYKKMYAFSMVIGYSKILVSTHSDGEPKIFYIFSLSS